MAAMVLDAPGKAMRPVRLPISLPQGRDVLLRVQACGVCRTDLHLRAGELPAPRLPLVLGHEIVGTVVEKGPEVTRLDVGARVGVPWLGWTCGVCRYCRSGRENLCDRAQFTGCHRDGGYAEYTVADERYCFALPSKYDDAHAAPLLCAGLIGHRALRTASDAARLGIYGFGAAAHLVAQVARFEGREVFAFTREGDLVGQAFARELGAAWAGASTELPPEPLDAALIFAPVGSLVPLALKAVVKGGTVVCAGIHMSPIPSFPYEILWGERSLRSVANLTRQDGEEFMRTADRVPLQVAAETLPLSRAEDGPDHLASGKVSGALVLVPQPTGTDLGDGPSGGARSRPSTARAPRSGRG
jgi:propanol-preferring alcohol dehydrogenase